MSPFMDDAAMERTQDALGQKMIRDEQDARWSDDDAPCLMCAELRKDASAARELAQVREEEMRGVVGENMETQREITREIEKSDALSRQLSDAYREVADLQRERERTNADLHTLSGNLAGVIGRVERTLHRDDLAPIRPHAVHHNTPLIAVEA